MQQYKEKLRHASWNSQRDRNLRLFFSVFRIHDVLVWIRIRILDPDPSIFVIDLQDANNKTNFLFNFFCLLLFEDTFISYLKIKSQKESQNSRNQGFSYYFCMMIEGSGSIPLTNGSGSRRPKNLWIRSGFGTLVFSAVPFFLFLSMRTNCNLNLFWFFMKIWRI